MILAGIKYIYEQVTRCQFYLNKIVTLVIVIQADKPMCKESRGAETASN